MFTAGFAEMDEAGEAAQDRMVAVARAHGMRILGPNCLGVFDARTGYYATFSSSFDSGWPVPGRIGIASPVRRLRHASLHAGAQPRHRRIALHHDRQRGRRDGGRMHRLAGGEPRGRRDRGLRRGHPRGARPDRRVRSGARGEEADRHAEGRPQRTWRQGGEIAHRLDRRRRCGDRGGHGRVRRGARAQLRGDAGHRAHRDAANISGAQHAGRDHGVGRRGRADQRRGGAASACRCRRCRQEAQTRLRELVPFCAPRNPVDATAQVGNDVALLEHLHRIAGARWRLRLGAGVLQHDRLVAPLAADARADQHGAGEAIPTGSTCCR